MSEPAVASPAPPDVERANLEVYERVFRKCIDTADRILHDHNSMNQGNARLELAKVLFERFYSDQATITQAEKNAQAMVKSMTAIMESRR